MDSRTVAKGIAIALGLCLGLAGIIGLFFIVAGKAHDFAIAHPEEVGWKTYRFLTGYEGWVFLLIWMLALSSAAFVDARTRWAIFVWCALTPAVLFAGWILMLWLAPEST